MIPSALVCILFSTASSWEIKPFVGLSSSWSVPVVETDREVAGSTSSERVVRASGSGGPGYGMEIGLARSIGLGFDLLATASYGGVAFTQILGFGEKGNDADLEFEIEARFLELDAGIRWSPTPRLGLSSRVGYARYLAGEYEAVLYDSEDRGSGRLDDFSGDLDEIWDNSKFPGIFDTRPQSFATVRIDGEVVVWSGLSVNLGWIQGLGPIMEGGSLTSTVSRATLGARWTFGNPTTP